MNGQRLLQSSSDIFLDWSRIRAEDIDFYVRQLRDMKGPFDFSAFSERDLIEYAVSCGHALTHSMAKSGDPALIPGYLGKSDEFDEAIQQFAIAYADRNEEDWSALKAAAKSGKVEAQRE